SALASGSEDCTIKIWDWEFGELERTLKGHSQTVTDLDFGSQKVRFLRSGENRIVSASRDASIRIWNVATGYCIRTIYTHGDWIYSLSTSVDGKWLVTGGRDQAATIWDVTSGQARSFLRGHDNHIECSVFAPTASHQYLAAMSGLKTSSAPGKNADAEFVATGGRDKTVKLWDGRGRLIKTLVGHDSWVQDVTFHPGGRYLLSVGDDCTIRCWDLSRDARLVKIDDQSHKRFVSCIRWASNLETQDAAATATRCVVATGSRDSCVRIFK
ncbi:hypothetical protein F1880_002258, partial [Penicillium rolfsii]